MDVQNLFGGGSIETANLITERRRYGFRVVLIEIRQFSSEKER